jgi:preprotein translocase subunit SecE
MKAKAQKSKTSKNKKSAEASSSSGSRDTARAGKPSVQKAPRTPAKKTGADGGAGGIFSKASQFLREAKTELKKVKWPTKKELLASTAVVIVLSLLIAFYLGLIDFILIKIIKLVVG